MAGKSPLNLLQNGWAVARKPALDVSSWVVKVQEHLDCARDIARDRMGKALAEGKAAYDKCNSLRTFQAGDLVWSRLLGLDHKLRQSCTEPLEVIERLNNVNYRIKEMGSRGRKRAVHINTLKKYVDRVPVNLASGEEDELVCMSNKAGRPPESIN